MRAESLRKRKTPSSWERLRQWKALDSLFTPALPASFSLYKRWSFPLTIRRLVCGSPCVQTLNSSSLLIPNKLIFAGEIPVYLLEVMCTHTYIHTHTYAYAYRYTNIHTHTYELRCCYLCSFCLLAYLHNMANLWAYINSAKCLKRMIAPEETILYSFCCLPFKWPSSS